MTLDPSAGTDPAVRHVIPTWLVATSGTTVMQVHVVASGEIELMTRLEGGRVTTAVVRTGGVVGWSW